MAFRKLRGVVFDMDGTLTVPAIDFPLMYRSVLGDDYFRAVAAGRSIDILQEIEQWNPERQERAHTILTQVELEANGRLQIMPGARELCEYIDAKSARFSSIQTSYRKLRICKERLCTS